MQKKIVIIGANRIIRESLMRSLSFDCDFVITDQFESSEDYYRDIMESIIPDVTIFFIHRMEDRFLHILHEMKKRYPQLINIVICHNELMPANRLLLESGIDIQIGDQTGIDDLKLLLRTITNQKDRKMNIKNLRYGYISEKLLSLCLVDDLQKNKISCIQRLTNREKDIYVLLSKGMTISNIAIFLDIQESTVKKYLRSANSKIEKLDRMI